MLLEDAIDVHDRHWKIHWMLNFAQFSATMALNATIAEVKGEADPALLGRLQSSIEDRNWDSIEALWQMKEEIKGDDELREAFRGDTAADVLRALEGSERGRRFLAERLDSLPAGVRLQGDLVARVLVPDLEGEPGADHRGRPRLPRDRLRLPGRDRGGRATTSAAAQAELMDGVPDGRGRDRLQAALELSLRMNPLTPDHHFFIDQGTNARVRLVLRRDRAQARRGGRARRPGGRGLPPLQRAARCWRRARRRSTRGRSSRDRRDEREGRRSSAAARSGSAPRRRRRSRSRTGRSGASPRSSTARRRTKVDEVHGLGASPGVVEGVARSVASLDEFDQVQDGEILVCQMTNPAWVVLFTKIAGLVTDAGGMAAHPAVVAREFGIPAVVGTSDATERIKTRRPRPRQRRDRRRGSRGVCRVTRRLVDLSMPVHPDMLTFPRVPPPALMRVRELDAVRRADRRRGVRRDVADRELPDRPERPRRHALRRAQAHRPERRAAGGRSRSSSATPTACCSTSADKRERVRASPRTTIDEASSSSIGYELKERDIVLIRTGAGDYNTEERYSTDIPGMTAEATRS